MEHLPHQGFTLSELLSALAITAILTGLAIPSFMELLQANHLTTQASRFVTAANLARSEAIKRNQPVILCLREQNGCGESNLWQSGWIVFVDENGNQKAESEEIIRFFDPLASNYSLTPNRKISMLIYYGNGWVRAGPKGGLPLMTFRLCGPNAVDNIRQGARELVINASGRIRTQLGRPGKTKCS